MSDVEFSDDEEQAYSECKDWEIPFGKYEGFSLTSMISSAERRRYLRWMITSSGLESRYRVRIQAALKEYGRLKPKSRTAIKKKKAKKETSVQEAQDDLTR